MFILRCEKQIQGLFTYLKRPHLQFWRTIEQTQNSTFISTMGKYSNFTTNILLPSTNTKMRVITTSCQLCRIQQLSANYSTLTSKHALKLQYPKHTASEKQRTFWNWFEYFLGPYVFSKTFQDLKVEKILGLSTTCKNLWAIQNHVQDWCIIQAEDHSHQLCTNVE